MGDWDMHNRKQEHAHDHKQQLVHPNHYPKVQLLPKTARIMKLIEPLVKLPALGTGHDEMKPHRVLQMIREDQQNAFELRGGGAGGGGGGSQPGTDRVQQIAVMDEGGHTSCGGVSGSAWEGKVGRRRVSSGEGVSCDPHRGVGESGAAGGAAC